MDKNKHCRMTPLKAIRVRCIECSGFEMKGVRECPFDGTNEAKCPLHHLRMGKGAKAAVKIIRSYCLWCCNGQKQEVRLCTCVKCPLWEYRFGTRPKKAQECPSLVKILTTEEVLEAEAYV